MIVNEEYRYALSLDRAAYPLWKKSSDDRVCEILNSDSKVQHLKCFAILIRQEALKRLENGWNLLQVQQAFIEPMVEKILNIRAIRLEARDPSKITFLIHDLGGNGDLIFGVKAFKVLSHSFPKTAFHIVTNGINKLRKILHHKKLNCPVSKLERRGFEASFDSETQKYLENSDIVFESPTASFDLPSKVVQNKKNITLLEYNRPDYGINISKRIYVTGIGDQACGIFIDQPNMKTTRNDVLAALDNKPLAALLQTLDSQNKQPIYFGYGHNDVERFLSVLINYETGNGIVLCSHFKKEKLLLPRNATVILHQKICFLDVLEAFRKQGASIDIAKIVQFRQEMESYLKECDSSFVTSLVQEKIQRIDEIIAELESSPTSENPKRFIESLKNGFCNIGGKWLKNETLVKASKGNTIHVVIFNELSFDDTQRIKSIADEICLSTGDQSFSEDISLRKLIMYDTRKIGPIEALASVADQQKLSLISRYFRAFASGDVPITILSLRKRNQLRQEANKLYEKVCKEMDLAPQLVGLVKRQMSGQLNAECIHGLFVSYLFNPRDEVLLNAYAAIIEHEATKTN